MSSPPTERPGHAAAPPAGEPALSQSLVAKERRTSDKYMGDGIMALFGAPMAMENPSLAAVECGQAMLAAVEAFRTPAGEQLHIGVGLHTDEVVVGNLGIEAHKSYTAIGSGVNVAARIETATGKSGTMLLFSEQVRADIEGELEAMRVDAFELKGIEEPVELFTVAKR